MIHRQPERVSLDKVPIGIFAQRPSRVFEIARSETRVYYVYEAGGKWHLRILMKGFPVTTEIIGMRDDYTSWESMEAAVAFFNHAISYVNSSTKGGVQVDDVILYNEERGRIKAVVFEYVDVSFENGDVRTFSRDEEFLMADL